MDIILSEQTQDLIDTLAHAQAQATRLLQTAHAHRRSFSLEYNHIDDDILQLIGRLRYMLLLAQRHTPPDDLPPGL